MRLILTDTVNDRRIRNYYCYDAFGESVISHEDVRNRFRFNGEQYDPVTSQYYLRARFYNPVIGRFTQEDTYYGDGLNLYEYCRNNPIQYRDPSGHDAVNQGNLYKNGSEVYSVGDATFMDADDAFVTNISRRKDVDPNGYYDVIAHGASNSIQITYNGQHISINHRVASRFIQNLPGYNGQAIRLLCCNTGSLDNGFAQNLANKLNVKVYAPTNYLWSTPNGKYFVAGMNGSGLPDFNDIGNFKLFTPGGK